MGQQGEGRQQSTVATGSGGAQHPVFWSDPENPKAEWRRLVAELVGTFLLTFVAAGAEVIAGATGAPVGHTAKVVAPGLMVMAAIYTLGDVSGAHINPAVTLAFALRRDFPWRRVPGYWGAQFVGGVLAAGVLSALFGQAARLGVTKPHAGLGSGAAFIMELLLTWLLVVIILGAAHNDRLIGHNAALAVGGTVALAGLFASPVSGASMNPARSFGPAVLTGALGGYWLYLVAPLLGAILASATAWVLRGGTTQEAVHAAGGD